MHRIPSCLLVLALAGPALSAPAASADAPPARPAYVLRDLSTQTPGAPGYGATPTDINNKGVIVGGVYVNAGGGLWRGHAAVWRDGQWQALGVLPGDTSSGAVAINSGGVVVGGSSNTGSYLDPQYRGFVSDGYTLSQIPALDYDSIVRGLNDAGQVCGRLGPAQPDYTKPWHAVVVDGNSVLDLHPLVETAMSRTLFETDASALNNLGDVVGRVPLNFEPSFGYLYWKGSVTLLRGVDASDNAWSMFGPAAINDTGIVAGEGWIGNPPQQRAFLYDAATGTVTDIGSELGGEPLIRSSARGINAAGHVVGRATSMTADRAFLYRDGVLLDLNTLIPQDSGRFLHEALAINDLGQIVVRDNRGYSLLTPANGPPSVTLAGPTQVDEGAPTTVSAEATDPEGGELQYKWDLDGDGTYETPGTAVVSLDPVGDDGPASRAVAVQVTDDGDLVATASATIAILNVPPTATLSASAEVVYAHEPVTLSLTNPVDPSPPDTAAGFSYEWDCTSDGTFEAGGATTHACVYPEPGLHTATGRIWDKDGGRSDSDLTVTVLSTEQRIEGLIGIVESFDLPKGIETSYVAKLRHALAALEAGDVATACDALLDFINHTNAQAGKKLTDAQATLMISEAEAIRSALGCS